MPSSGAGGAAAHEHFADAGEAGLPRRMPVPSPCDLAAGALAGRWWRRDGQEVPLGNTKRLL